MKILIIIPVFNEENNIEKCIDSIQNQIYKVSNIIIVNDGSTDKTLDKINFLSKKYKNVKSYDLENSLSKPLPGKKIIKAFNYGLTKNKIKYDFIGKFDGDLILPKNYFEILINEFKINNKLGLASGVIASMVNEKWLIEKMYNNDHVRGGIKFYSREAFKEINGLKESIGWDTLDEMQLKYFRYEIKVFKNIITKQTRKTGDRYIKKKYFNQGKVMYLLGYDVFLAIVGSIKFSLKERSLMPFLKSIFSYFYCLVTNEKKIVNNKLANFIKNFRYKRIKEKIGF